MNELGEPVTRDQPRDVRLTQAKPPAEARPDRGPPVAEERQAADAAAELTDQPARGPLAQPLEVAAHLVGPGGGLEAEGDRRARLPVGAAHHRRLPVALSERQQRGL